MKNIKLFSILTTLLIFLVVPCTFAEKQTIPSLNHLQSLVKKWVHIQTQISQEKIDWKEEEESLKVEKDLLLQQKENLAKNLEIFSEKLTKLESKKEQLSQEKVNLEKWIEELNHGLDKVETNLLSWKKLLPKSLVKRLKNHFKTLHSKKNNSLPKRINRVLFLIKEINQIQNNIHLTKEIIEFDGKKREYDVLFLGLSVAYASHKKNFDGLIGYPNGNGWNWKKQINLSSKIQEAIAVYKKNAPPKLVSLPFQLGEDQ